MNPIDIPVIDTHQHLIYPANSDPTAATALDIEAMLHSGDIEAIWLLSLGDGIIHDLGDHDEAVLRASSKYPHRIIPFGYLDFRKPPSHVDELKKRGFPALKAHFPLQPYDHRDCMPYYERAAALGMPIVFHTGGGHSGDGTKRGFSAWTYPDGMLLANSAASALDKVAKYFPELVIVIAHMGGPSGFIDCIQMARNNKNIYFDVACSPLARQWQERTREVIETCGAGKMLIGTDTKFPSALITNRFWKYFMLTRAWLSTSEKEDILFRNAKSLIEATGYDVRNIRLAASA